MLSLSHILGPYKLKELLTINWRRKFPAHSRLKVIIEDTLDTGLPREYSPELYQQKCSPIFEHVYETYPERDTSAYTEAI